MDRTKHCHDERLEEVKRFVLFFGGEAYFEIIVGTGTYPTGPFRISISPAPPSAIAHTIFLLSSLGYMLMD